MLHRLALLLLSLCLIVAPLYGPGPAGHARAAGMDHLGMTHGGTIHGGMEQMDAAHHACDQQSAAVPGKPGDCAACPCAAGLPGLTATTDVVAPALGVVPVRAVPERTPPDRAPPPPSRPPRV